MTPHDNLTLIILRYLVLFAYEKLQDYITYIFMKFIIICYALILTYLFTIKERQLIVGIMMQPSNKKDYPA